MERSQLKSLLNGGVSMRRVILACAIGALLLGALLAISSTLGRGGSAKGTEVWWYEGSGPLIKATFRTTRSGIVNEWRHEPEDLKLIFKPADKFSAPVGGIIPPGLSVQAITRSIKTVRER